MSNYYTWINAQLNNGQTTIATSSPISQTTSSSSLYKCGVSYNAANAKIVGGSVANVRIVFFFELIIYTLSLSII